MVGAGEFESEVDSLAFPNIAADEVGPWHSIDNILNVLSATIEESELVRSD